MVAVSQVIITVVVVADSHSSQELFSLSRMRDNMVARTRRTLASARRPTKVKVNIKASAKTTEEEEEEEEEEEGGRTNPRSPRVDSVPTPAADLAVPRGQTVAVLEIQAVALAAAVTPATPGQAAPALEGAVAVRGVQVVVVQTKVAVGLATQLQGQQAVVAAQAFQAAVAAALATQPQGQQVEEEALAAQAAASVVVSRTNQVAGLATQPQDHPAAAAEEVFQPAAADLATQLQGQQAVVVAAALATQPQGQQVEEEVLLTQAAALVVVSQAKRAEALATQPEGQPAAVEEAAFLAAAVAAADLATQLQGQQAVVAVAAFQEEEAAAAALATPLQGQQAVVAAEALATQPQGQPEAASEAAALVVVVLVVFHSREAFLSRLPQLPAEDLGWEDLGRRRLRHHHQSQRKLCHPSSVLSFLLRSTLNHHWRQPRRRNLPLKRRRRKRKWIQRKLLGVRLPSPLEAFRTSSHPPPSRNITNTVCMNTCVKTDSKTKQFFLSFLFTGSS